MNREPAVLLLLDELVGAPVPDLDRAGPVLPGRDLALEVAVVERVILDVHRQVPLAERERDALRHRPAQEHPVPLEAEVVVEAAGGVALDDEAERVARLAAERLGRALRIALLAVRVERHHCMIAHHELTATGSCGGHKPRLERIGLLLARPLDVRLRARSQRFGRVELKSGRVGAPEYAPDPRARADHGREAKRDEVRLNAGAAGVAARRRHGSVLPVLRCSLGKLAGGERLHDRTVAPPSLIRALRAERRADGSDEKPTASRPVSGST